VVLSTVHYSFSEAVVT